MLAVSSSFATSIRAPATARTRSRAAITAVPRLTACHQLRSTPTFGASLMDTVRRRTTPIKAEAARVSASASTDPVPLPAKIGAALFVLWGILHLWVPAAGYQAYLAGTAAQWKMIIGGSAVPTAAFVHATSAITKFAHSQLMLNFVIDVGGYGLLGFLVAYKLWTRASVFAYVIGAVIIGIADLAFLFGMVTSGVIAFGPETLGGPIIWFLALLITPFGLKWPGFKNLLDN